MSGFSSSFSVAGMSASGSGHGHGHGHLNASQAPWGQSATGSSPLNASLNEPHGRSQYQSGYLLSASQASASPQGAQRPDELPIIPSKTKMNQSLLLRGGSGPGATPDFGAGSMFQSSRQRQTFDDEDAPPKNSVNDIPNGAFFDSPAYFQRSGAFGSPSSSSSSRLSLSAAAGAPPHTPQAPPHVPAAAQEEEPVYVIVFGYPPDKYTLTVEYFRSLAGSSADTTEPDPSTEVANCFRIGYRDVADAARAVRKNGEVLGGSWMVGAKWADPQKAEALLGPSSSFGVRSTLGGAPPPSAGAGEYPFSSSRMAVDEPSLHEERIGTPVRLAPSASIFRKAGPGPGTPVNKPGSAPPQLGGSTGLGFASAPAPGVGGHASPGKGVLGQVSDLIFGW